MKHEHHAIENSIFHSVRQQMKKIEEAKQLLKKNKYIIYKRNKK
jgi:hypothetical protein